MAVCPFDGTDVTGVGTTGVDDINGVTEDLLTADGIAVGVTAEVVDITDGAVGVAEAVDWAGDDDFCLSRIKSAVICQSAARCSLTCAAAIIWARGAAARASTLFSRAATSACFCAGFMPQ